MNQTNPETEVEKFINELEQDLPNTFPRSAVSELTGGVINGRTLANKMALRIGPKGIRVRGKVVFVRSTFIEWLRNEKLVEIG